MKAAFAELGGHLPGPSVHSLEGQCALDIARLDQLLERGEAVDLRELEDVGKPPDRLLCGVTVCPLLPMYLRRVSST